MSLSTTQWLLLGGLGVGAAVLFSAGSKGEPKKPAGGKMPENVLDVAERFDELEQGAEDFEGETVVLAVYDDENKSAALEALAGVAPGHPDVLFFHMDRGFLRGLLEQTHVEALEATASWGGVVVLSAGDQVAVHHAEGWEGEKRVEELATDLEEAVVSLSGVREDPRAPVEVPTPERPVPEAPEGAFKSTMVDALVIAYMESVRHGAIL